MGQIMRYEVKRDVLLWAIHESQKIMSDIEEKFPKINEWIEGDLAPTMKQIESLANYLKVPFGYMFLAAPPKENVMQVEFRSIDNKLPDISKNLKDTLMEMDRDQSWMSDFRQEAGWEKLDIISNFETEVNDQDHFNEVAKVAKKLLDIEEDWYIQCTSYEKAYNFLREKLEDAGVLVMQNGTVGFDTHRVLDINEFRAFMLYDDYAPLIFINGTDYVAGKIFSLIHEYVHILYHQDDIILENPLEDTKANERKINQIAAEILMPENIVRKKWDELQDKDDLARVDNISKSLKVSNYALAIKLSELGLLQDNIIRIIAGRSKTSKKKTSGGDFYKTYYSKMSSSFLRSVVSQTESGNLSYTYAFKLLGDIKGTVYNQIRGSIYG